jgi:PAS domain S-box-containing protein
MVMKLSNIKIVKKLYAIIIVATAGMISIAGIAQYQMERIYEAANYATINTVPSILAMSDALTHFYRIRVDIRDHIVETDPAKITMINTLIQEDLAAIEKSLKHYENTLISNDEDRRLLVTDRSLLRDYIVILEQILTLSRESRNTEALELLKKSSSIAVKFDDALQHHMAFNRKLADQGAADAASVKYVATWISIISALFILTLTSLIGWIISNQQLMRPIEGVINNLQHLSNGKLDVAVDGIERKDEFGDIARAVLAMQDVYLAMESKRWVNEQLADIAQALQVASTYKEFGDILCSHLAQKIGLAYGALFVANADKTELNRFGGYGCDDNIHASHFLWGQSLVGQAAQSKKQIVLSPTAGDRVAVSTGLGTLLIHHVLIAPIVDRDTVLAVLELGTLQTFDRKQMLFLETLLPDIAEKIQILAGNVITRELLDQTQVQAQALAVSEQQLISRRFELEENNNKLAEQARVLEESADELEQQKFALLDQRESLETSRSILAQNEERNRLILNAVSDGIVGMDTEGKIVFCNSVVSDLLGYSDEEIIGQSMHERLHYAYPDGREFPIGECSMYHAAHDGTTHKVDNEVLWRKDGSALPISYVATAIYQDNRITGSVIVFRDITKVKQAEEESMLASSLPNVSLRR